MDLKSTLRERGVFVGLHTTSSITTSWMVCEILVMFLAASVLVVVYNFQLEQNHLFSSYFHFGNEVNHIEFVSRK